MYGADPSAPEIGDDPLVVERKLAGIEPVRPRRSTGAIYQSPMLGRLHFVRMAHGQVSFWSGEQRMPDSRFALQIVCEVDSDRLPGPDHVACVVALRRHQVQDAMQCVPLINARLQEQQVFSTVSADDLVLTAIHLPPHPFTDARYELSYRSTSEPKMQFTVTVVRGVPHSVRIDSDA